jgi:hypothetical protein
MSKAEAHCFPVKRRQTRPTYATTLGSADADALAALLPLLCCGEEAAVSGFERLGLATDLSASSRRSLLLIADDERRHDAMLHGLRAALPQVEPDHAITQRTRRFHRRLTSGGTDLHLARIAGLDSAVCTILSRLLRSDLALSRDDTVRSVLSHIRHDETRHVLISRNIALTAPDRLALRTAAAEARAGLADLLQSGAASFEALGVDSDRLVRDIAALPNGLLPQ